MSLAKVTWIFDFIQSKGTIYFLMFNFWNTEEQIITTKELSWLKAVVAILR